MRFAAVIFVVGVFSLLSATAGEGKHLFILSGQSNMQGHRPEEAFTPVVELEFGKENVIVVQDAQGGQPIQRWYKDWKSPDGEAPKSTGDLYDRLMAKVKPAIEGKEIATVTFFWMQGEKDARMKWGDVYEDSLRGLHKQLSDYAGKEYPDWEKIREIQVKVADSDPTFAWVDTDDLNDGKNRGGKDISNDLHFSGEGYKTFGKRMAEAAIGMIEKE